MVRTVAQIPTSGRKPKAMAAVMPRMLRIPMGRIAMAEHLVLEFRNEVATQALAGEANRKEDEKNQSEYRRFQKRVLAKN